MSNLRQAFVDSITALNTNELSSDFVNNRLSFGHVEQAFDTKGTVKIRIAGRVTLSASDSSPEDAKLDEQGHGDIRLLATLAVHDCELGSIRTLTREPDGSFSFVGVGHSSYAWERNYNAGWQTENTYTTYKVSVDPAGNGRYEVLDVEKTSY